MRTEHLRQLLTLFFSVIILSGCSNSTENRLNQSLRSNKSLNEEFFVGRIIGGDLISHVFHVTLDTNSPKDVDIGEFKSSCSCTVAKPKISLNEGWCTLVVTLEWRAPLPVMSKTLSVQRQEVVSKGVVKIGGQSQEVEFKLVGDVCSPLMISSTPLVLNRDQGEMMFDVKRGELPQGKFLQLQIRLDPGFKIVEEIRDSETISLVVANTASSYKSSAVTIRGLSSDIIIPIVINHGSKVQLVRDIVFAERNDGEWITLLESHGVGRRFVRASSGIVVKLSSEDKDTERWKLTLPNDSFVDSSCDVSLDFNGPDGNDDVVKIKVWKNVQH